MFDGGSIAAEPIAQETRYPADRRDTHAGHIVDAAIGKFLLQKTNDLPAIDQCLQLRRRAQVLEKVTNFLNILQAVHCAEKGIFVAFLLAGGIVSVRFHGLAMVCMCANVLTH